MRMRIIAAAVSLLTFGIFAQASVINADTIYISTLSGQSSASIFFSSPIFIVSGSSLSLEDSGGYINTASSIAASSFFGDGSHLSGVNSLSSTQTFSGANTFTSSFTVQSNGNQIILSTSGTTTNISISSAGVIAFYPKLHNSSGTIIPQFSTTGTAFGPCVTGSTLTITTTGGRVELEFVGTFYNSAGGSLIELSFLQDGQFVNDLNANKGIVKYVTGGNSLSVSEFFNYILNAPVKGTHSYCLTMANSSSIGGTTTLINSIGLDKPNATGSWSGRNLFYAKEIK